MSYLALILFFISVNAGIKAQMMPTDSFGLDFGANGSLNVMIKEHPSGIGVIRRLPHLSFSTDSSKQYSGYMAFWNDKKEMLASFQGPYPITDHPQTGNREFITQSLFYQERLVLITRTYRYNRIAWVINIDDKKLTRWRRKPFEEAIGPRIQAAHWSNKDFNYKNIELLQIIERHPDVIRKPLSKQHLVGIYNFDSLAFKEASFKQSDSVTSLATPSSFGIRNNLVRGTFGMYAVSADWHDNKIYFSSMIDKTIQVWSPSGDSITQFGKPGQSMDPPYHIVDYKPRKDQDFYFYDKLIENNLYQSLFADTTNNYILRMYSLFEEDTVSKSIPDTLTKKAAQKQKVQIRDKLANNLYYNKPKYLQVYTEQGELKADFQVPDGTKVINAVPGKIWLAQERTKPNGDLRVYEYAYEDILEHSSLSNRE